VINEIQPQGSNQPKLLPRNQRGTTVRKEKYASQSGNMGFKFMFFYDFQLMKTMFNGFQNVLDNKPYFWIFWIMWIYIHFLDMI
jgi:hypothetical protein